VNGHLLITSGQKPLKFHKFSVQ